jgi:hypothetical protein
LARNQTVVDAPVHTVFAVLSDPRAYDDFVVGTKRVRRFTPTWPQAGSVLHHTLGIGPLILRDLTWVVEVNEPHHLVLRAQMRPFSVNRIRFSLRPQGDGTKVEVEEYAIEGPAAAVWGPLLDRIMWLRNKELLRRLKRITERRLARQTEPDAS